MEKEASHYSYETYSVVSKQSNSGVGGKRDQKNAKCDEKVCKCFGSKKSKRKQVLTGLVTNLGICVLLFGYTLIGSVIFLAIEGGNNIQKQILATTSLATEQYKSRLNNSAILKTKTEYARAKTVESIWDITVSLNILYRDNWTKLAAQEITRFQNELLKSLEEEMFYSQPVQEKESERELVKEIDWTFARAFLYSLTVLTTVGK
ncbi:uncharacterized protein LOC108742961 [Agrilus planipennis]|uniref:Uncharacterized protein LOC108742961 n=1 Tax=Agrilus planipennis TaxID=224129 RepID=A0A1W4XCV8_AGRPL|nr:uncharacterized protein LOC108742961 [Agrilus planipennis]XP_025831054.1 uncharacterized protein LOC108742961 [Agrilus planipennis]XP_025831055.1 uncharacterized protein LOC108742961 [Agrilus planipennis]XP_025831056.1 uncharacterized protein LOC108742961 [Agrilus planipennis]